MPQVIQHIDKIARDKKRDVLYVEFDREIYPDYNWEEYKDRNKLIKFLNENKIDFIKCADIASENGWESYRGQLYIDLPYDENNEKYKILNNHLEFPDGTRKIQGIIFYYLSLEIAMKNAHHDEPGFWDKWAEGF